MQETTSLTVKDLSLRYKLSEGFIRKLIRQNKIPHANIGGRCIRFEEAEIISWWKSYQKGGGYNE